MTNFDTANKLLSPGSLIKYISAHHFTNKDAVTGSFTSHCLTWWSNSYQNHI